jgi:hypothetical protein
MLLRDHEALSAPADNCTLWRYMDFTKFVSLLETRALHFTRADQFEDPYEGSWSQAGWKMQRDPAINGGLPSHAIRQMTEFASQLPKDVFLNCWYLGAFESAAMWKLYAQSHQGIAVRSDYNTLAAIADESSLQLGISRVHYIDYDQTPIPFGNILFPFVHKRLSFAHENELRLLLWRRDSVNEGQVPPDATTLTVSAPPDRLLHGVYVAPTSPRWFGQLVEAVCRRYGLSVNVVRSSLYDRPTY